ncbi:uncharacterized protein N7511_002683 [Penicillium nucicola]|uniref:uncharacterized protein n=1 Tax=Penicillium nucicola TaxID=1850975 RepID=UPI0025456FB3|nr:uncharacterized protein N7511_002683 [Penicillium nucicola]KAJ5770632.1 hypothetical protein N7511_002683 [Penicillium nucicola]
MTSVYSNEATSLSQRFEYQNSTHSFRVQWRSLGNPTLPPLIFIHGTPWSYRLWVPFAISLSRNFHVYLFDRPGFGDSPPEQRLPGTGTGTTSKAEELDSDLARQSEVFAALFKSWQRDWPSQKANIVAHDNAGLVSLRAHLLHDCQYASLCLIDVVAIGPFGQSLFDVVADDPGYFERLPDMAFEGILESYIRNAAFYELSKEVMGMLKAPWMREGGRVGFLRELCQANLRSTDAVEGRYGEVGGNVPVKVIWGAEDLWIPVESAGRLGSALRAKEVVVIENAGHLSMLDQPGQFGVELGIWLGLFEKH